MLFKGVGSYGIEPQKFINPLSTQYSLLHSPKDVERP